MLLDKKMHLATQTYTPELRLGFERGMRAIKDAGFDSVDLSLFRMDKDDNIFVSDQWEKAANERREILDTIDIPCTQAHAPHIFEFGDDYVLNNIAIPRILRSMDVAKIMGAKLIVVHPLHHLDYYRNKEKIRNINYNYMLMLADRAEKIGITVGFENMWQHDKKRGCISHNVGGLVDDLIEDFDSLNSSCIKVCLDVGHSALVGEEPQDTIRKLGFHRLKALHVHDNDYKDDQHTLPYLGKIDWNEVMKALNEIGYDGEFTYEADNFLLGFPSELIPSALNLMAVVGKYLIAKVK